ncbi:MAG: CvfB family protein [Bacteroidota bacterium]
MFTLGLDHTLIIDRLTPPGLFLKDNDGNEVLLPNKYIPEEYEIGDEIEVFIYLDHSERPVATTLEPYVKLDEFAMLTCIDTNQFGSFMDWGLEKHLFVPYIEQAVKMKVGEQYLVFCYLDESTNRLVASSKVHHFVDNSSLTVEAFEEVDLMISSPTDLGYNAIINDIHLGLIFESEIFEPIKVGQRLKGFIKKIREDNKIDLTLQRPGYRSIEPNADKIVELLQAADGFLPLHDKSNPDQIKLLTKMSKKAFKKAVGTLYKNRQIDIIKGEGIKLKKQV